MKVIGWFFKWVIRFVFEIGSWIALVSSQTGDPKLGLAGNIVGLLNFPVMVFKTLLALATNKGVADFSAQEGKEIGVMLWNIPQNLISRFPQSILAGIIIFFVIRWVVPNFLIWSFSRKSAARKKAKAATPGSTT